MKSYSQLRSHILRYHCHNNSSQHVTTSTFKEYKCFYCDEKVTSRDFLEDHKNVCSDVFVCAEESNINDFQLPSFPCDECEAQCTTFDDLGRHITIYHQGLKIMNEKLVSESLWCEFCPLYFERNEDLQHHRSRCHLDQMKSD